MSNPNLSSKQFRQAKVTRVLNEAGIPRRRKGKTRKRSSWPVYHAGVTYTPVDEGTTAIEYVGSGNGSRQGDAPLRERYHPRIVEALKAAGFNAEEHGDQVHVEHS